MLRLGEEQAEERRAEQHSRDHLRDHLRLPEGPRDGTDQTAEQQDDGELQEEVDCEVQVVHASGLEALERAVVSQRPLTTMREDATVKEDAELPIR